MLAAGWLQKPSWTPGSYCTATFLKPVPMCTKLMLKKEDNSSQSALFQLFKFIFRNPGDVSPQHCILYRLKWGKFPSKISLCSIHSGRILHEFLGLYLPYIWPSLLIEDHCKPLLQSQAWILKLFSFSKSSSLTDILTLQIPCYYMSKLHSDLLQPEVKRDFS